MKRDFVTSTEMMQEYILIETGKRIIYYGNIFKTERAENDEKIYTSAAIGRYIRMQRGGKCYGLSVRGAWVGCGGSGPRR